TERKQAEDEIQRLNAELEERVITRTAQRDAFNRELEAFAYSAAHDLRAPLRAIDGFSKIVIDDAAERLTPEEVEHLERVRAAAQRMAQMIDDLMGLSKVTRRPLLRREVDVSATAREVAEELRAAQPRRRVEVVVAPGMTAAADPALLRLVLVQLLDNAWKFTSHHDAARIEVGVAIADADADGGGGDGAGDAGAGVGDDGAGREERVFFVRDDGAGFDMGYAKQLFGAFQRFHAAGEFEGGGIGLAMVQRLVLRHGGRVWAEAEVEKGATFFFTLPRAELAAD
ncbi:MAG: ATP-binding protein, partial [Actinomycetes bacterium]